MKRALLFLVLFLPASAARAEIVANPPPAPAPSPAKDPASFGTLRWKNGETLNGDLAAASSSSLSWKTPLFEDPLQIAWPFLDRIEWIQPATQPVGPFAITLRDGSFLYGDLIAINSDSVSIRSPRLGDVQLKRSVVLNLRRLHEKALLFTGPTGDVGWEALNNMQEGNVGKSQMPPDFTPSLMAGPGGALLIRNWNRAASLDLTLPESIDVDFRVHSTQRPAFAVAFGGNVPQALRVETWDNELVLVLGDQFKTIKKIEDSDREVAVHVLWNKKTRICSVYTPDGELITTWQTPETDLKSIPGFIVQNKGLDLSIDFLRIKAWDGKPPTKYDLKQPHVELSDGRIMNGEIVAGAPGFIRLQSPGQTAPADLPISTLDTLILSSNLPQLIQSPATLLYADGTLLLGEMQSAANGRAILAASFAVEPLNIQTDLLRQILIREPLPVLLGSEVSLDKMDTIHGQDTTLHGKLETAGDSAPRWTPVGGTHSSRLSSTLPCEITRPFQPDSPLSDEPALFYMRSGDVLPGSLQSLDRSGAEFESNLMDARKLPASELNAIQFGAPTRIDVHGFSDPSWIVVKGDAKTVRRQGDNLEMDPGTSIACPSLLQTADFSFKYPSKGFSATRLRLFAIGTDGTHAIRVLLGNTGNQFICGSE